MRMLRSVRSCARADAMRLRCEAWCGPPSHPPQHRVEGAAQQHGQQRGREADDVEGHGEVGDGQGHHAAAAAVAVCLTCAAVALQPLQQRGGGLLPHLCPCTAPALRCSLPAAAADAAAAAGAGGREQGCQGWRHIHAAGGICGMVKDPHKRGTVAKAHRELVLPQGAASACCCCPSCHRQCMLWQPHEQLHSCGAVWPGVQGAPRQLGAACPQLLHLRTRRRQER